MDSTVALGELLRRLARRHGRVAGTDRGPAATGLDAASVDAVLCVAAIQFARQQDAAQREQLERVLAPGGRAVLTCWEPSTLTTSDCQGRLRRVGPGAGLATAGFNNAQVQERPGWRARERAMWEEASELDPGDDPAPRSFHDEGVSSLEIFDPVRWVIATAAAPVAAPSMR